MDAGEPERSELLRLAERHGIGAGYFDIWGNWRAVPDSGLRALLQAMGVAAADGEEVRASLRSVPPAAPGDAAGERPPELAAVRCYEAPALRGGARLWGVQAQLYALRSTRNWGIGDFGDLAELARRSGAAGAAFVGVNPLHALYPDNPAHASPYSPSSRRFLNVLYIDVERIPEFAHCAPARALVFEAGFQQRLRALRASEVVDYPGVSALKRSVWELLFAAFRAAHLGQEATPRGRAFRAFQGAGGAALRRHALFEALQERFRRDDSTVAGWPQWPAAFRDPRSPAVAQFLRERLERVEFFEYLQWQADQQLAAAAQAGRDAGLAIGLYADLAVSIDGGGAESWSDQEIYARGASVGCPPDDFNLHGQDWGLLPPLPRQLREHRYAPFVAALRAAMRHAGALRIDHVMGLMRLFWVPRGARPEAGGYVSYPFDELLALVALESARNRCVVIGEDLGTVPDEVRAAMGASGMLSYRVLWFAQQQDGDYLAPEEFPRAALVTATTHDLATVAGWWEGRDLEVRRALGLFPGTAGPEEQWAARKRDTARLRGALQRAGLLPEGIDAAAHELAPMDPRLAGAVQAYLARTPAALLSVQLEDVFGCRDQLNLPGTVEEYANWRRKLPLDMEQWDGEGSFAAIAKLLASERGAGAGE